MKYWIKDRDQTPQQFPLKALFHAIISALKVKSAQIWIQRSSGYGTQICKWDTLLDAHDKLLVEKNVFEKILKGTEEWFYNLDAEIVTENMNVYFGLHDSTAMYVSAPSEFIDLIINNFDIVEKDEDQR